MKKKIVKVENLGFPPSVQSSLFCYLKPEQQEFIKPILHVLKNPAQEELCCMLLDYMETGEVILSNDFVINALFRFLTRYDLAEFDDPMDKAIIRPLCIRSNSPVKVGELIDRFFPQFKK